MITHVVMSFDNHLMCTYPFYDLYFAVILAESPMV